MRLMQWRQGAFVDFDWYVLIDKWEKERFLGDKGMSCVEMRF